MNEPKDLRALVGGIEDPTFTEEENKIPRTGADDLIVVDAADYLETEPPPPDPILKDVCERGDKVDLIAPPKTKKTFLSLEMGVHLAAGRSRWLDFDIPKRRRVLYINLELRKEWTHRRVRSACRAWGIEPNEIRGWLRIVNARGKGGMVRAHLVEVAVRENADLVIVDPRYKLHLPGEAENAGEGVQGILDLLDALAESGPAVLVVHHDPKGDAGDKSIQDRGGGSGWASRDADARITLTPQKTDPDKAAVVEVLNRNFAPREKFTIRWEEGHFVLAPDLLAIPYTSRDRFKAANGGPSDEQVDAAALEAATVLRSRAELEDAICKRGNASRAAARASLDRLVRTEKIAHTPRKGSRWGAVKYGTPEAVRRHLENESPKMF